jgi:hypothetical protein
MFGNTVRQQPSFWRKLGVRTAMTIASLLLTAVSVLAVVYCSGKLYQFRAERLYSKVRSLRVGLSTFEDARALAKDYKRNLEMETAACTTVDCRFTIRLTNVPFPAFYDEPWFWKIGVRPAVVVATVSVKSGTVAHVDFGVSYRTQDGYWLQGSFHAAGELTMYDKCSLNELGRSSQYAVTDAHLTNGDGGGQSADVAFGQGVSDEQRVRATAIRLGCITTIPGCKTLTDLMPKAWEGVSFDDDSDASFDEECKRFIQEQAQKQGAFPWQLDSAFEATPVTVNYWMLTRPSH